VYEPGEQPLAGLPDKPMVPAFRIDHLDTSRVRGLVRFGTEHHGSRQAVHGGAIATILDEVLGRLSVQGEHRRSRTASLRIDYRALTPLGIELQFDGWLDGREGRKYFVAGELRDGAIVLARASALYVGLLPWQEQHR
jgi:acyl-coenzyme A thioesterase PaaI-like protein